MGCGCYLVPTYLLTLSRGLGGDYAIHSPTQVGLLTGLRSALTLNDNQISGTIPSEIGELSALALLDLYANDIKGDPPATIANMINLRQIYVDQERHTPLPNPNPNPNPNPSPNPNPNPDPQPKPKPKA